MILCKNEKKNDTSFLIIPILDHLLHHECPVRSIRKRSFLSWYSSFRLRKWAYCCQFYKIMVMWLCDSWLHYVSIVKQKNQKLCFFNRRCFFFCVVFGLEWLTWAFQCFTIMYLNSRDTVRVQKFFVFKIIWAHLFFII